MLCHKAFGSFLKCKLYVLTPFYRCLDLPEELWFSYRLLLQGAPCAYGIVQC